MTNTSPVESPTPPQQPPRFSLDMMYPPERLAALNRGMIRPSEDNQIDPIGSYFARAYDREEQRLWQGIDRQMWNAQARAAYLNHVRRTGNNYGLYKYAAALDSDSTLSFSPQQRAQEFQQLSEGWMNAAEAERRWTDHLTGLGDKFPDNGGHDPVLTTLQNSIVYRERAQQLRSQFQPSS